MWKSLGVALLTLFLCSSSFASNAPDLFKAAFVGELKVYRPAQCGRNVYELARLFEQNNVVLQNAQVLFFLNEYRTVSGIPLRASLLPSASRAGVGAWDFHVVLVADSDIRSGKKVVYDLDWKPKAVDHDHYLASMFPDKAGNRYENILVRSIPLPEYLELLYGQDGTSVLKTVGELRSLSDSRYPVTSLAEYLEKL